MDRPLLHSILALGFFSFSPNKVFLQQFSFISLLHFILKNLNSLPSNIEIFFQNSPIQNRNNYKIQLEIILKYKNNKLTAVNQIDFVDFVHFKCLYVSVNVSSIFCTLAIP